MCVNIFKRCIVPRFPTILYGNFIMVFVQTGIFEKLNVVVKLTNCTE